MKATRTEGEAVPRHRAPPRTLRGLRPCDPENHPIKTKMRRTVSLPLVGTESYRLIQVYVSPPGYILS